MTTDDEPGSDPFEGLTLDELWATAAAAREPTAEERLARAARERDRLERDDEAAARSWRQRRNRRRRNRAFLLASLLLFGAAVAVADRRGPSPSPWAAPADGGTARLSVDGAWPTPAPATSTEPLGRPADPDASGGTHEFIATQPDGSGPVAYDPCRPIEIVVDERSAPPGGPEIVDRAIERVRGITGLQLRVTGTTTEQPGSDRAAVQQQYGDRWAPVLVSWTDAERTPALAGTVAGLAGSVAVTTADGPTVFATGMVALDAPDLARILQEEREGSTIVEDIVLHELGHLVGLDHVDSTAELMYSEGQEDLHGYQPGDLAGLSRLGQGRCVELL
ncbi:matrixin family metalloprotease [Aquihabitans daechungensis]|uniref:matrixin family metalloprotease n=1 Tax=Aquihabitans daechungensis TaxID=1052257 RepID=UPI003BA1B322